MCSGNTQASSDASGEGKGGASAHWEPERPTLAIEVSPPDWPREVPISRRFLDRHPESCVHGVRSVHAQLILGIGAVGRLDHCQHCKGIDVHVPQDLLVWKSRSWKQETLHSECPTRQKLSSVSVLQGRRVLSTTLIPAMATCA